MKNIFVFTMGFICCFIFFAFSLNGDIDSVQANDSMYKQVYKTSYPIHVNNKEIKVDAVTIDGSTYVPLRQIADKTSLIVEWNDENPGVYIVDSSSIKIETIDNKKYVDMTYWFDRYNLNLDIGQELPYAMTHNSIELPDGSIIGIPMVQLGGRYSWYLDYDYFIEYVYPLLFDMISSNEEYLKKHMQ